MVHRDIAARNFLVSSEGRILISDFGLSRSLTKKNPASTEYVYYKTQLTEIPMRSSAPEAIIEGRWTVQSDIWSFGIAVWQVLCNSEDPYPGVYREALQGKIQYVHLRPEIPAHTPDVLRHVMTKCWQYDPSDRPKMNFIIKTLIDLVKVSEKQRAIEEEDAILIRSFEVETYECLMCFDDKPMEDVSRICKDNHMMCHECTEQYLLEVSSFPVRCPQCFTEDVMSKLRGVDGESL